MLDFMRKNANSWVMIFLFAIIIFVFAINFGPWAGRLSENVPYAALVNNKAIPNAEYQNAYVNQLARIRQFRPDYNDSQADKDGLRQLILSQLIDRELLTQEALKYKLNIGATTLAPKIKELVFGPNAPFDKKEYQNRVHSYFQTTVSQFEQQVENDLLAGQMANVIGTGVYVSDAQVRDSYLDKNTKIAVEYIKVSPEYFKVKGASLNQIADFVDKNKDQIAAYYSDNVSDFVREARVKASHILIKSAPDASPQDKAKHKARAEAILERVKNNKEDFAKVAKSESEDLMTKANGGDLDFFTAGAMVPEFSKVAFSLKPNEISDVVETPYGFHIIKVDDRTEEQKVTLEKATNEIAEKLINLEEQKKEAKLAAEQALAQLKSGAPIEKVTIAGLVNKKAGGKSSDKLAPVADETTTFSKSAPFIPGIGRAAGFSEQAFKLSLDNKSASEVFESGGQFFAIRIKQKEEADLSKFDAEKATIKNSLLYARRRAFVQQYLTQLKAAAKIKYNPELVGSGEIKV